MEIEGLTYSDVGSMDLMDMEAALKESPWFSYLREILMEKLYRSLCPDSFQDGCFPVFQKDAL